MITRRSLVLATAAVATASTARAQANWPEKPVRLIIGYPAGGPTDFGGRLLQDPLGRLWGQPIVIENRPGASQVIASEAVARSPADGYTIFLAACTHASNAAVYARLPYDTIADFTPIVNIYASPTVLFVGKDSPYRTVAQLVDAAKRDPGMPFAFSITTLSPPAAPMPSTTTRTSARIITTACMKSDVLSAKNPPRNV